MRAAEIDIGSRYRVRKHNKRVGSFPSYWSYWTATIVAKEGRRYVIEWSQPKALHNMKVHLAQSWTPLKMIWVNETVRATINPSQIIEKVGGY